MHTPRHKDPFKPPWAMTPEELEAWDGRPLTRSGREGRRDRAIREAREKTDPSLLRLAALERRIEALERRP